MRKNEVAPGAWFSIVNNSDRSVTFGGWWRIFFIFSSQSQWDITWNIMTNIIFSRRFPRTGGWTYHDTPSLLEKQSIDIFGKCWQMIDCQGSTLQGTNISHLGKRKIIFKMPFLGDMLIPWRVVVFFCQKDLDAFFFSLQQCHRNFPQLHRNFARQTVWGSYTTSSQVFYDEGTSLDALELLSWKGKNL